jgi:two-component sensor histidine kinase
MKDHKKIIKLTEIFLISFVWLVLLITPVLFREESNKPVLGSVFKQLETLIPLSLLFLINRFVLVPRLLFGRKQMKYVFSALGIIVLFMLGLYLYHKQQNEPLPRETSQAGIQSIPPAEPVPGGEDEPETPRRPRPLPPYANFLILSILVVGFDTGLRATLRWTEAEQEKVRLEKENVATQLMLLQNQVSPHFFMNTLNNIHSLVDIDTGEAKEAILKLSKMMRYLLYETETKHTTLKREIEFLQSYINLMKLRLSEKVKITVNFPQSIPDKTLPPLLFTSIIENAFKHGISYKDESFISIDMVMNDERLLLTVKNSKSDNKQVKDSQGIGIENTRKRLDLLYGDKYHLYIIDNENLFTVNLSIPL